MAPANRREVRDALTRLYSNSPSADIENTMNDDRKLVCEAGKDPEMWTWVGDI
jgi:hypothetical protein